MYRLRAGMGWALSRSAARAGVMIVIVVCCGACLASAAVARQAREPRVVKLHVKFRTDGHVDVLAEGAFVFRPGDGVGSGTLFDEQTSHEWAVPSVSGCSGFLYGTELIGRGWLLGTCQNTGELELYRLPGGPWRTLATPADCQGQNSAAGMSQCLPDAVGADWIELAFSCYHCQTSYRYENIATGAETSYSPSSGSVLDLSSPTLRQSVCRPLGIPTDGSLSFDGSYAIVQERHGTGNALLEQCGERRVLLLGSDIYVSSNSPSMIVWRPDVFGASVTLGGLFLPSRQPFTLGLPEAIVNSGVNVLTVTPRHIYVFGVNGLGTLWVANRPKPPDHDSH
jgi:hypothetical protein